MLAREIASAGVTNQTISITLSNPDQYAIYLLADLFALPKARLSSATSTHGFLKDQLLVSSGPFVLREFTQRQGVYLQTDAQYFGQSTQIENIYSFEEGGVLPGSSAEISSLPLVVNGQPIQNASFSACAYDQSGVATECATGNQTQNGAYSAILRIDSRFHSGSYRIETSLYAVLPNGTLMIFGAKQMTIIPSLIIVLVLAAALLIIAVAAVKRRELLPLVRRRRRRRAGRRRTVRRRTVRRTVHRTRKRASVSTR